jgi:uncharacterized protein DUF2786
MSQSDVLRRVRALLDKAESTTYDAEREACVAKAQALMVEHAVGQATLAADPRAATATPVARRLTYATSRGYVNVRRDLLATLARANRCQAVVHTDRSRSAQEATLVGFVDDLAWVEMLYTSLLVQLFGAAERAYAATAPGPPATGWRAWRRARALERPNRRTFTNSFGHGFVHQVADRLRKATEEATLAGRPGAALVLSDRAAEVDAATRELFGDLTKLRAGRSAWSADGYRSGQAAGDTADLGARGRSVGANRRTLPGSVRPG